MEVAKSSMEMRIGVIHLMNMKIYIVLFLVPGYQKPCLRKIVLS